MKNHHSLPGLGGLLQTASVKALTKAHGRELTAHCLRKVLDDVRNLISDEREPPPAEDIVRMAVREIERLSSGSLQVVINASGVLIHTNLGRVPFGTALVKDSSELLTGYTNLEFDLVQGTRSDRNEHAAELIKYLTGAEDALVVNNNAAAVLLILGGLARNKEVVVSRGELIEIGGSFRMPDIMAAAGCRMAEVGTTNKTRISDYRKQINENTALLFKAHKSNFKIKGFTEEAKLEELCALGKETGIPVVYDMGSGLLKQLPYPLLEKEPTVDQAFQKGVDLVSFSGDKLLGGPQAGIIAGRACLVQRLKKEPMMRALRVCKLTLAYLETACKYYLNPGDLHEKNLFFSLLKKSKEDLKNQADHLASIMHAHGVACKVIPTKGQYGGGSMPDDQIESFAVCLSPPPESRSQQSAFAEHVYLALLHADTPVVGVLKQGKIHFDLLAILDDEMDVVAREIVKACHALTNT